MSGVHSVFPHVTKTRSLRLVRLLVPVFALLVLSACGSSGGGSDAATETTAATSGATTTVAGGGGSGSSGDAIEIKGFAFNPKELDVKVGTTVTWTNGDPATHTATSDDGTFDTKSLKTGKSGTFTFEKAGTYTYHCGIHPTMTGTVVVG